MGEYELIVRYVEILLIGFFVPEQIEDLWRIYYVLSLSTEMKGLHKNMVRLAEISKANRRF